MKRLIALAVAATALAGAGTALAGGWATVGLAASPDGVAAGETWRAQITVLRHGVTPTDGARPTLTIRNVRSGKTAAFAAKPAGNKGVYEARVVFPESGTWSYAIDNGLAATGYGVSATTTYAPVAIGPGDGGSSVPVWPFVAGAALALAALAALAVRRRHRLFAPSH